MKLLGAHTGIKMIYNNLGDAEDLKNAWGLAIWIEDDNEAILFDTGGEAETLEANIKQLNLDVKKLSKIVISHDHWDHKGGLGMILDKLDTKPEVYVTSNTEETYKKEYPNARIIGVSSPRKITSNLWTTGSLFTDYKGNGLQEQSLIFTYDDNMILLTGCSHPGIVNIVKKTMELHPDKKMELLAGGFHLMRESAKDVLQISDELKTLGIESIAPSHCTGDQAIEIFRKDWGEKFIDMNLGNKRSI